MDFTFTDDQLLFRDALRDALEKECPPEAVRAAWTSPTGRVPGLWARLGEMGVLGLLTPEAAGGLGGDELDLVLLLEETGRAAVPDPVVETAAVAVPLLRDHAPTSEWLAGAASGAATVTLAPPGSEHVAFADDATVILLTDGDALHAVPADAVSLTRQPSVDGARRLFSVDWTVSDTTVVVDGDTARAALAGAWDRGVLGTAAQLVGLAQHLLDVTVAYAKEREQFGQPIGSFQAVKHHLADALLALEFARPVVYRAAWSLASRLPERSVDVSMAKAFASDAATRVARTALQVHGAIGYAYEYDLHLWMKRVWALAAAWGDAPTHRRRVGAAVLGEAGTNAATVGGSEGPGGP